MVPVAGHCDGCGKLVSQGDHTGCVARRAATDPPRFCVACGRKLVVQVLPIGWVARCVRCGPVLGLPAAQPEAGLRSGRA
jgi:hypothetical protein